MQAAGWQRRRSGHFPARRFTALVSVVAVPQAPLKLWWVKTPYPRLRCLVISRLPFREHRSVARALGIDRKRLYEWYRQYQEGGARGLRASGRQEACGQAMARATASTIAAASSL
jgi:Helix-turn-helix domain